MDDRRWVMASQSEPGSSHHPMDDRMGEGIAVRAQKFASVSSEEVRGQSMEELTFELFEVCIQVCW